MWVEKHLILNNKGQNQKKTQVQIFLLLDSHFQLFFFQFIQVGFGNEFNYKMLNVVRVSVPAFEGFELNRVAQVGQLDSSGFEVVLVLLQADSDDRLATRVLVSPLTVDLSLQLDLLKLIVKAVEISKRK